MLYIYIVFFIFCVVIFFFLNSNRKIDACKFVKYIQSNNSKKIIHNLKRVKDINSKFEFKADLIPSKYQIKTKLINEKVEFKSSFINIQKATILMIAIIYNNKIEVIKKIIEMGADVNLCDENKNTAFLYSALYYNNPDIFDLLIENGADKNVKNILWANAIMVSLYNKELDILKRLIDLGLDINIQNKGGWTPLMSIALDFCSLEKAKTLIEHGADINLKNKTDKSALDIAKEFGNNEFIDYINSLKN